MPKQPTKTQRIICALLQRGSVEVLPSASRKYQQFTSLDNGLHFWVGHSGALRIGRTSSQSRSLNPAKLLAAYPMNEVMQPTRADLDAGTRGFTCVRCTLPITDDARGPGIMVARLGPVHRIHATKAEVDAHLASDKPLWKVREC